MFRLYFSSSSVCREAKSLFESDVIEKDGAQRQTLAIGSHSAFLLNASRVAGTWFEICKKSGSIHI